MSEEGDEGVGVGDVLEAIADTILQLVLFQVEAKDNESTLVKLEIRPLLGSIKYLVDLAKRKAAKWNETDEAKNKSLMLKACATMAEATGKIDSALDRLDEDPFDDVAKDDMLWSARSIVQSTVGLLQLADNYDIRKLIKATKSSQTAQDDLCKASPADLPNLIRDYVTEVVTLAKLVEARINYIVDPVLKKKFDVANAIVRDESEPLIRTYVGSLQDPSLKDKLAKDSKTLSKAYKKIAALAKMSSQEMFSGIDLNLNPLDDDDSGARGINAELMSLEDACRHVMAMADNGCTAQRMLSAVAAAQAAIQKRLEEAQAALEQESDPAKAKTVEAALGNLRSNLGNLTDAARQYAKDTSAANTSRLRDVSVALLSADAAMQQAIDMPDHLDSATSMVQIALATLADAARFGKEAEVIGAAKAVNVALQEQVAHAKQKVARDAKRKKALNAALSGQQGVMRNLLKGTKALIEGRDASDSSSGKWDNFNSAIDDVSAYSQRIGDLSDPSSAAQLFMSPEERLQCAALRVNEALQDLQTDPGPGIADALRDVGEALNAQMAMAKKRGKRGQALSAQMAGVMKGLIKSARNFVNEPGNTEGVDRDTEALKDAQAELLRAAFGGADLLVDSCGEIREHCAQLLDAIETHDARAAAIALQDVRRDLHMQADALESIEADGAKQQQLRALAKAQRAAREMLPDLVDKALQEKQKGAHFKRVEAELQACEARSLQAARSACSDPESAAVQGAAKLESALSNLKHAANSANDEATEEARRHADIKLRRQLVLADILADRSEEGSAVEERLTGAGGALGEILKDLIPSVDDALDGDLGGLHELEAGAHHANRELLSAIEDPAGRMEQLGVRLEQLVDGLQFHVRAEDRDTLVELVDTLQQQTLLGEVVGAQHQDRAVELRPAVAYAHATLSALRPRVLDTMQDLEDASAQNQLEDAVQQARKANRALVEAAQPELLQRILSNVTSCEREVAAVAAGNKQHDKGAAVAAGEALERRALKQAELLRSVAARGLADALTREFHELANEISEAGPAFARATRNKAQGDGGWQSQTAFTRNENRLKKLNARIRAAVDKARNPSKHASSSSVDDSWSGAGGDGLRDAALKLRKVTRELKCDDTPKGLMFAESQKIAAAMQRLAAASGSDDKKGMIDASKEISTCSSNVARIARTIPASGADKDVIMSFALAAKGQGVQLKILAAVKASIVGKDKTAESQLVTCCSGLAEQVIQAVNHAFSAEIRQDYGK